MPTLVTYTVNQQGQASTSIADDRKIITHTLAALKMLATEYECPICLDALTDTRIKNPECRHRFCGDCIKESLRRCNNECPSCRVHIPTKRTMRKDPQFDKIVSMYVCMYVCMYLPNPILGTPLVRGCCVMCQNLFILRYYASYLCNYDF